MKVSEFIKRKNRMIYKATGVILVPEDQIVEVDQYRLSIDEDVLACPYCMLFFEAFCTGCPMNEADNNCSNSGSTYVEVAHELPSGITDQDNPFYSELSELINQYNAELDIS